MGKLRALDIRQETAQPVEQETMFRVVQEARNAGQEEGDYLGLVFFAGEEKEWKIHDRYKKEGKQMIVVQEDTYVEQKGP